MMEEMLAEEPAGDFLVCDGYKCDLPKCEESQKQPPSNVAQDGIHQHQSSDTKEPEKQTEALSTLSRHPTIRASLAVRNRKGTESGPHPTQDEEQPGRLSGQQVQLHAGQAGTCPDRNPKDDISKCDDQNYASDQATRQSEKANETDRKEASGGLPQVLSWPESLDGHLSQLDEFCSPRSSTRSKNEDEKNAEPKLRSPMGDRHPLSWPQSIKSFGKSNNARKGPTTVRPPLFPDKITPTTTTPPIQRRNTMSAIMGMKRPFQKQKSDSGGQFK